MEYIIKNYLDSNRGSFKSKSEFIVSSYSSKHGILELKSFELDHYILIKFLAIDYIELPRIFYGIDLKEANKLISKNIREKHIINNQSNNLIFNIKSNQKSYFISAKNMIITKHKND